MASLSLNTATLTIAGWLYHETDGGIGCDVLYLDANGGLGGADVAIFTVNGNLVFFSAGSPFYSQAIATGGWSHVALTRDGTTQRAFVNAAQVGSAAYSSTDPFSYADIGSFGDNTNTLQDVMLFSVALSTSDLAMLYRVRFPLVKRASLYAWWPLFADSATRDWTGHGHTLSGSGDSVGTVHAPAPWGAALQQRALRR